MLLSELDLSGYVLLPAPAEPHAHLDKALTAARVKVQAGDLEAAIEAWHEHRRELSVDDIARRAERAALISLARGVTAVRTHVDVGEGIELRAAAALVGVRDRLRGLIDLQVVALSYPLANAAGADNRALLRGALELGVDVVGGAPHIDPDPVGHMEVCLELAAEFGRPVDLHMDEHLRSGLDLADIARLIASGFPQHVAASHCSSLGMQSPEVQDRLAGEVAAAGISVVSCPGTNLHLQARPCGPQRRAGSPRCERCCEQACSSREAATTSKTSSIRSAAATRCRPPRCLCSPASWTSLPPTGSSATGLARRWTRRPATTTG